MTAIKNEATVLPCKAQESTPEKERTHLMRNTTVSTLYRQHFYSQYKTPRQHYINLTSNTLKTLSFPLYPTKGKHITVFIMHNASHLISPRDINYDINNKHFSSPLRFLPGSAAYV